MFTKTRIGLSVALVLAGASAALAREAPTDGTLMTQVSDKYDKAIDSAQNDKALERAMNNICRGC